MKIGKAELPFFIGLGVMVLAIVVAAIMAVRGLGGGRAKGRQLAEQMERLRWFYTLDPFPSRANTEVERESTSRIRAHFEAMLREAGRGQMSEEVRTPPIFMQQLGLARKQLVQDAGAQADRILPVDFAFGFDHYFSAGAALPRGDQVGRLLMQLKVIQSVCKILFEEGIDGLKSVTREAFDVPSAGRVEAVDPETGVLRPGATFSVLRFSFTFEAREKPLLAILNRLTTHEMFMVVRTLKLEKKGDDIVTRDPKAAVVPAERLSRMQRLMSGAEMEAPGLITLEVDVYRFREGAPAS